MAAEKSARAARLRRHIRARKRIMGSKARPRLCVFRSLNHIYAQVIDDTEGHTLTSASTVDREIRDDSRGKSKREKARLVGALVAKRTLEKGIKQVVFDRGGYKYFGRVQVLADTAREAGLIF